MRPTAQPGSRDDAKPALPRLQAAINNTFDAADLSLKRCAEIMAEIAEHSEADADRLRAIDMRFRMTTGYAPTRQQNLNLHARTDQLYSKEVFEQNPGIALDDDFIDQDEEHKDPNEVD